MKLRNTVNHIMNCFFHDKQIGFPFEDADIRKVLKCTALSVNVVWRCASLRW